MYVIKITCGFLSLGPGFGGAREEYLTYFRGHCMVGGVNSLGGQLTHDGDEGQMTVGRVVAALEIPIEVREPARGRASKYRGSRVT